MCQLRRFQDGTIKETVNIEVSSWGGYANDFVLDKIVHLISVHYAKVEVKVCRGIVFCFYNNRNVSYLNSSGITYNLDLCVILTIVL